MGVESSNSSSDCFIISYIIQMGLKCEHKHNFITFSPKSTSHATLLGILCSVLHPRFHLNSSASHLELSPDALTLAKKRKLFHTSAWASTVESIVQWLTPNPAIRHQDRTRIRLWRQLRSRFKTVLNTISSWIFS